MKSGLLIFLAVGLLLVVAYKRSETKTPNSRRSNEPAGKSQPTQTAEAPNPTPGAASSYSYNDPPQASASIAVEDAYTAIPHRRTVWSEDQTTVPAGEREYLRAMFHVLDQTVVARVAGIQNYSRGDFTSFDAEGELGQLSDYVRQVQVPSGLADYNKQVLAA